MVSSESFVVDARRARVDDLIAYHAPISRALTDERTSLESRLIPVSAYVITACIEAYLRYPEMMAAIDARLPAEEIGRRARRPGCRVNTVSLWSIANFWLLGRKVMRMVDPSTADDVDAAHTVLDFWERSARGFRGDGTRQAWDSGDAPIYGDAVVAQLVAGAAPVDGDERAAVKRFNATLIAYLFLLYFDTRVGAGDTGPYPLPDGRVLLVRDYYQLARSDFWWSDVAEDVPYRNLTAALVLDGVSIDRVTDFGTSYTTPEDYLDHLVAFGLFTTDGTADGELLPVPPAALPEIVAAVRPAQSALYRAVAEMDRHEKIRCGAYVYFSFLRPFAAEAGMADDFDWSAPRDIPGPLYDLVSAMEGDNTGVADDGPYYEPLS
jgi:hypothetical protein